MSIAVEDLLGSLGLNDLGDDAPLSSIQATMEQVRKWRRTRPAPDLEAMIGMAARKLWRAAGVDRPAELWDATSSPQMGGIGAGVALDLHDPRPWEDPVDGLQLAEEILSLITRHLALPSEEAAHGITLWILFAHAHEAFPISPLLAITSPVKRCGKTTLLELLGVLCPKPMPAANLTLAVTFRSVEKWTPTLLVDEADTFLWAKGELRGVLNSGHRKATAFVARSVGDDFEPRLFRTWCPKVIAQIGELPDTLADRSIRIPMRRREPGEKVQRLRLDRIGDNQDLQRKAWKWGQDNLQVLGELDPSLPDSLHDRQRDNWRALVAISELLGGSWPERARKAAVALSGANEADSEDVKTLLLEDLRAVFMKAGKDRLASTAIVKELHQLEDRPWPEWGKTKKPITTPSLARLLKPFGVKPEALWIGDKTTRGYALEDLEPLFSRYLPSPECKGRKDSTTTRASGHSEGVREGGAPFGSKSGENPINNGNLTPLTVSAEDEVKAHAVGGGGEDLDLFRKEAVG